MSSLAQLEADLFLAERAFKRIPSDENKAALAKVKKALESLGEVKETVKAATPKPTAPKPAKATASKAADNSKKK